MSPEREFEVDMMPVQREVMTRRGYSLGALVTALLLIGAGAWVLALNLGAHLPDIWQFWPALLIVAGVFQALGYAANPRANPDGGRLWSGLMAVMVGLLFLGISLGATLTVFGARIALSWTYFWQVWPAFPAFAGIAWLAQYAATAFRRTGLLVVGLGALATGVVGFGAMYGLWALSALELLWPVALILAGVALLASTATRRR